VSQVRQIYCENARWWLPVRPSISKRLQRLRADDCRPTTHDCSRQRRLASVEERADQTLLDVEFAAHGDVRGVFE
jgi:hypothetical protein